MSGTDIFLSYARNDRSIARLFADSLVADGFSVWWDASLHSGETFDEVIEQRLRDAKAVIVLWSPRSVASRWVRAEATLADRRNKLVPAIIEACDRPIIFELTHAADLTDWKGDTNEVRWQTFLFDLRRLVDADKRLEQVEAARPALTQPPAVAKREEGPSDAQAPRPAPRVEVEDGVNDARSSGEVHFLEMEPGQLVGDPIAINSSSMKIGRSAPADIVLPHKSVSREHCVVGLANDELFVTDLNSTNGTYIDGARITRVTILPVGSILQIGQISMKHSVRTKPSAQHGQFRQSAGDGQQAGRLAAAS